MIYDGGNAGFKIELKAKQCVNLNNGIPLFRSHLILTFIKIAEIFYAKPSMVSQLYTSGIHIHAPAYSDHTIRKCSYMLAYLIKSSLDMSGLHTLQFFKMIRT